MADALTDFDNHIIEGVGYPQHLLLLHDGRLHWQLCQVPNELIVIDKLSKHRHYVSGTICLDHGCVIQDNVHTPVVSFLHCHVEGGVESCFNHLAIFLFNHRLVVDKLLQQIWVDLVQVEEDLLQLDMVIPHEVTISEACAHVEQIVVWLRVEHISFLEWVLFLDFVFYHKGDVAEGKRDVVALVHQPVMVLVVKAVTSFVVQGIVCAALFLLRGQIFFKVKGLYAASLLVEDDLVVR